MKKLIVLLMLTGIALLSEASLVSGIADNTYDATPGAVDLTGSTITSWGYATGALSDGFTTKSGTTAPSVNLVGSSVNTTDFGWDFTTAGPTTTSASGGVAGMANGEGWDLTFAGLVSAQTQTLTLYLGAFGNQPGNDRIDITISSTLTGGTADETGTDRTYSNFDGTSTYAQTATAAYTIDFSSATETDLVLNFRASNTAGGRGAGVSGYTVIPEPATLGLISIAGLGLIWLRRVFLMD